MTKRILDCKVILYFTQSDLCHSILQTELSSSTTVVVFLKISRTGHQKKSFLFKTSASFSMGWAAFLCISPNVQEEGAMKEDTGTQDTPYTEVSSSHPKQAVQVLLTCFHFWCSLCSVQDTLVEQLEQCVDYLWKSERYELIADINKPVIAVFEKRRDFKVILASSKMYRCTGWSYSILNEYLPVFICRGCQSCTMTFIAPTWRWQRWWMRKNVFLVATTVSLFTGRWASVIA